MEINFDGVVTDTKRIKYAVKQNNNANIIIFKIDKIQDSIILDASKHFYIKVQNSTKSFVDKDSRALITEDDENIYISWTMLRKITQFRNIDVQVQYEDFENDIVWQTEIINIDLFATIQADREIENMYPSILSQMQEEIDELKTEITPSIAGNGIIIEIIGNNKKYSVDTNVIATKEYVDKNTGIPFNTINKISDYLYEIEYDVLNYQEGKEWIENQFKPSMSGCSSVRKGKWYGRNLDWYYNHEVDVIVRTHANTNRYATIGVAGAISDLDKEAIEKGDYTDDLYKAIPFVLLDGINEKGLFVNTNVIHLEPDQEPNTHTVPTEEELDSICATMLPRFILDNYSSVSEAINNITKHISIYPNKKATEMGLDIHFMIGDTTQTICLEIINNEIKITEQNILTNFYLNDVIFNDDGSVYTPETSDLNHDAIITNHIQSFGMGLERWNLINSNYNSLSTKEDMIDLMKNKLDYRKSYNTYTSPSNPYWYTEFTGENSQGILYVNSRVSDYDYIVNAAGQLFLSRNRDDGLSGTWHTMYTCVYDLETKELSIFDSTEDGIEHKFTLVNNYTKTEINELLDDKVDKVNGKQLSTNDYTNADKNKLNGIAENATKVIVSSTTPNGYIVINNVNTKVYDDNELRGLIAGKETGWVIDTQSQITGTKDSDDNYTNVTAIGSLNLELVKIGDNVYIKDTAVPDYWVSGKTNIGTEEIPVYILSLNTLTTKIDLSVYYNKTEVNNLLDTKSTKVIIETNNDYVDGTITLPQLSKQNVLDLYNAKVVGNVACVLWHEDKLYTVSSIGTNEDIFVCFTFNDTYILTYSLVNDDVEVKYVKISEVSATAQDTNKLESITVNGTTYQNIEFQFEGGNYNSQNFIGCGNLSQHVGGSYFNTLIGFCSTFRTYKLSAYSQALSIGFFDCNANTSGSYSVTIGIFEYNNNATNNIDYSVCFDGSSKNHFINLYDLDKIYFRNENLTTANSRNGYALGYSLSERLNGLTVTDSSVSELDYDKITKFSLSSNKTVTFRAAPTSTGANLSCIPEYKARIETTAEVDITLPSGSYKLLTNDDGITLSSNVLTIPTGADLEMSIQNGKIVIMNWSVVE